MKRREFITLLGSAAAAWPLGARAQQQRTGPVIGILGSSTAETYANRMAAFRQGLKEVGFVEGHNVVIEYRWANDQYDGLPAMAAELVRARVGLIAAVGNNLPARAAKNATSTIPIVFTMGADPVELRLVDGLSRPGGNVTGVTSLTGPQIQKRLQLLHDAVPAAKTFGLLFNPDNATPSSGRTNIQLAQEAVRNWSGIIEVVPVQTVGDFDHAFANLAEKRVDALATTADSLFTSGRDRLIALAEQYAMPAIFHTPEFARAGGLMSYSSSLIDVWRQAGRYAGRILKGEKPADLPVLLPTTFEFVVNMKTAKALGMTVPPTLLALADEVIE
jgi:ABC-type uncharacterized transport system substrate-binding protein